MLSQNGCKKIALVCCLYLFFSYANVLLAQRPVGRGLVDTVYLDAFFQICEKPVAEFFRMGKIKLTDRLFFYDTVTDVRIDGSLLMKGYYDSSGLKQGMFIFLRKNGTLSKTGRFKNNEMVGDWNFYNESRNVVAIIRCKNSTDYTPMLLITNNGDTLVKNGNGTFSYNLESFPSMSIADNFDTKGQVKNGLKEGEVFYETGENEMKIRYKEVYVHGELKQGSGTYEGLQPSSKRPFWELNLTKTDHFRLIDRFSHFDLPFEAGTTGEPALLDFLFDGKQPQFNIRSSSYRKNLSIISQILGLTFRPDIFSNESLFDIQYSDFSHELTHTLLSFNKLLASGSPSRKLNFTSTFTIDDKGSFDKSSFTGSLTRDEIDALNYYVARISGLALSKKNSAGSNAISVRFTTIIDTLTDINLQLFEHSRYVIYSNDSAEESIATDPHFESKLTFNAEPAAGMHTFDSYIKKSLNTTIPYQSGAVNGTYFVPIEFVVNADGTIGDVRAKNDVGYGMTEEAIRVIKFMPDWVPARKNGVKVAAKLKKEIFFKVEREE